jgi:type II secretory pathway component PulL
LYLKGPWKGNEKYEKMTVAGKHTLCQKHKKATEIENYKFSTKAHTNNEQEKVTLIASLKSLLSKKSVTDNCLVQALCFNQNSTNLKFKMLYITLANTV